MEPTTHLIVSYSLLDDAGASTRNKILETTTELTTTTTDSMLAAHSTFRSTTLQLLAAAAVPLRKRACFACNRLN